MEPFLWPEYTDVNVVSNCISGCDILDGIKPLHHIIAEYSVISSLTVKRLGLETCLLPRLDESSRCEQVTTVQSWQECDPSWWIIKFSQEATTLAELWVGVAVTTPVGDLCIFRNGKIHTLPKLNLPDGNSFKFYNNEHLIRGVSSWTTRDSYIRFTVQCTTKQCSPGWYFATIGVQTNSSYQPQLCGLKYKANVETPLEGFRMLIPHSSTSNVLLAPYRR